MDEVIEAIHNQARASAWDAVKIAMMLKDGYSEREIRHHLDLDTSTMLVYKSWIANAMELV